LGWPDSSTRPARTADTKTLQVHRQKGNAMTAIPPLRIHHAERPDASAVEAEREAQQRRVERDIAAAQREERRARYEAGSRQMTRSVTPPAPDTRPKPTSTGARIAAQVLGSHAEAPDPLRDPNPPAPAPGKMMGRPPSATEQEQTRRHREAALKALEERAAE